MGFMVIDELAAIYGIGMTKKKFDAMIGEGTIEGNSVVLVKPQTFMNLSGRSVSGLASFYKSTIEDLIVIHDDLDLDPGIIRVKIGGGTGGHKGLKSIVDCLGRIDFVRLRIGIGKPAIKERTEGYVLERFSREELEMAADTVHRACDAIGEIISSGAQSAMNKFNLRNKRKGQEEAEEQPD
jgi:PTH1 family peptidyl-tRNA hydrolase